MLKICAWCSKEMGYVASGKPTDITHGICDDCLREYFPEMANEIIAGSIWGGIWLTICQAFREAFATGPRGISW